MKKLLFLLTIIVPLTWFSCDKDPYDNIREFVNSETIYPEKFDTISAAVGFERVEIYLTRAGRSDSIKKNPSKARNTVVEYNTGKADTTVVFKGMQSWVNVTGLSQPRLYRFRVYTTDSLGNKSVYQEIARIPFTRETRDAIRIADPNAVLSPWGVKLWWPGGITTGMWQFLDCNYEYNDKDNATVRGSIRDSTFIGFDVDNLLPNSEKNVSFVINILPIVDGQPILDTVQFRQTIDIATPTADEYGEFLKSRQIAGWETDGSQMIIRWQAVTDPTMKHTTVGYRDFSNRMSPVDRTITVANTDERTPLPGLAYELFDISSVYEPVGGGGTNVAAQPTRVRPELAAPDVMQVNGISYSTDPLTVTKLTYPVHASLPIKSTSLRDILYFPRLRELDLTGGDMFNVTTLLYDRNSARKVVGGGRWLPFLSRIKEVETNDRTTISYLLSGGVIQNIKYAPYSMGLDNILSPYVSTGIVNMMQMPDDVLIPYEYFLDGWVQDNDWRSEWSYPAVNPPNAEGLSNVFSVRVVKRYSSFVFALPKEYRYNAEVYRYLKLKIYTPPASVFADGFGEWQDLWFRFMNHLWAFGGNNISGADQQYWERYRNDASLLPNSSLARWFDLTIDMAEARNKHTRIIVINIGGEPGSWNDFSRDLTFYFANVRLSKNP
ncbi:MAG: hypothetical protein LBD59_02760 [Prevotellaceae bacterium]|jgi:hypothetical protein|nr:hypothetical protein [Prevotellaceae bacterium]